MSTPSSLPRKWAVVDVEATGLDTSADQVLSVSLRLLDAELNSISCFSSLTRPTIPVTATEIHGITEEMVSDAPSFAQVAPSLAALLDGAVFVAHNAPYDASILHAEFARAGTPQPNPAGVLDTVSLARRVLPELPSVSLAALASHLGVVQLNAHDADDDTRVLAEILPHLLGLETSPALSPWGRLGPPPRFGSARIERIPVAWINPGALDSTQGLVQGMRVVFTGGADATRIHLGRRAQDAGLDVVEWVSAATSVLVAEPRPGKPSSKATRAAALGIPVVSPAEFALLLDSVSPGSLPEPAVADPATPARAVTPRSIRSTAPAGSPAQS